MANRYQDRSYPADAGYNGSHAQGEGDRESDPLAELARLIGQTDPFAAPARPSAAQPQRRAEPAPAYHDEPEEAFETAPTPPPWMQRVAAQRAQQAPQPEPQHDGRFQAETEFDFQQAYQSDAQAHAAGDYGSQAHALHEQHAPAGYDAYGHPLAQADEGQEQIDPNRYDDALYGRVDDAQLQYQQDTYQDDPYAYQQGDYAEDEDRPKRRGGLVTVAAVVALAVVGTGAAYGYRTFIGSPRSGEPPVIKADPGPNKIVPPSATADAGKATDRLASGQERMVPREEQPVNVQDAARADGPRVVFPPLNQNSNPPTTASVSPANKPMMPSSAIPGEEPRKVHTLAVRGDQVDAATATPAARQTPARLTAPAPAAGNASANAPLSLAPQAAPAPAAPSRSASLYPAPQNIAPAPAATGGYVVQVSSQRNDNDARASFRALQNKFPSVLGSRSPLIKRVDLGDKGTYYRAMVGPFGSSDEASQLCGNLKSAGGQCVVQRN